MRQVSIKHLPGLQKSFCLLFKQEVKHFNLPSLNITSVDLWTLHKFILRMNHTLHLVLPSINWSMIFLIQSNLDGHWFLSLLMSLLLHTNTTHLCRLKLLLKRYGNQKNPNFLALFIVNRFRENVWNQFVDLWTVRYLFPSD